MKNFNRLNKKNFLFYDYETFGLNSQSDRIAQFACVRTDFNFKILEKYKIFYCKIPFDYLPNPESSLVTSIIPQYVKKFGLKEFDFSKKIYNIFRKYSNTCIIGYNNISFDDEFTRNVFYRNFLDPYNWSWKNNNSRWDLINVIRVCFALRPKGILWSFKNETKLPIFQLSKIVKKNFINNFVFHHALSDVYATIKLSKLIFLKQPRLFKFLFFYRNSKKIKNVLKNFLLKPLLYISNCFGAKNFNIKRIFIIGQSFYNEKIFISVDIDNNLNLVKYIKNFNRKKKNINFFLENIFFFGLRFINCSKCPSIVPLTVLSKKNIEFLCFKQKEYFKNLKIFKSFFSNKKNFFFINEILRLKYFKNKKKCFHSDFQLYDKFFTFTESKKIFFLRNLMEKKNFLKANKFVMKLDNRIQQLFFFCKARNFPKYLTKLEKKKWKNYLKKIFSKKKIQKYKNNLLKLLKIYKYNKKKYLILLKFFDFFKKKFLSKKIF